MNNSQIEAFKVRRFFIGCLDKTGKVDHTDTLSILLKDYKTKKITGHYTNENGEQYQESSLLVSVNSDQQNLIHVFIRKLLELTNQECALIEYCSGVCSFLSENNNSVAGSLIKVDTRPEGDYSIIDNEYYTLKEVA
jgi:hypothetical protein